MDVSQSVPQGVFHISSLNDDILKMKRQLITWIMSSYWNVKETADPGGITSIMEEQNGKKTFLYSTVSEINLKLSRDTVKFVSLLIILKIIYK